MAALDPRVVSLRIERRRILELWISRLPSQRGKAADRLRIQAAGDVRRRGQAGEGE